MPKPSVVTPKKNKARTFFASLCGTIAISLILSSLFMVWLNRTLTNTDTYVKTVAPLATKPEIQTFIAQKTSESFVNSGTVTDLANSLLPSSQASGLAVDQLKPLIQTVIDTNVLKVVQSPEFAKLWTNTNRTAHASIVKQLDSNTPGLQIDLQPMLEGVLIQLKATQLAPFVDQVDIKPNTAVISLNNSGIDQVHKYYNNITAATWLIVVLSVIFLVLAVVLSTNHAKTFRRTMFGTGILSLLFGLSIIATPYINLGNNVDQTTKQAIVVFAQTILHGLQTSSLVLGVACIVAALVSKLISLQTAKKTS